MIRFSEYLAQEWKPALGCTEPAAIAYAASLAAAQGEGPVRAVHLRCDPRIYKNCYAVGIPNSERKVGIRWALALGSLLPDPSAGLQVFRQVDASALREADRLLCENAVSVEVDPSRRDLLVDCTVVRSEGMGRAVLERDHTRLTRLERNGRPADPPPGGSTAPPLREAESEPSLREELARMPFEELLQLARTVETPDRESLREGAEMNLAIARHGLTLFPRPFMDLIGMDPLTRISRLVCAGVYARMSGEDFPVMSLAGSGNKGIVTAVPLTLWARETGADPSRAEEALALACLVTSATTFHLGTLSAACGCSNAAGVGLAVGLASLQGGGPKEISLAVNNVVGNVTGMICDGAKMGCALKTMTSVDAAFRAASLAMSGIGIPATDGIVGEDGSQSLAHLGRIAGPGMGAMDAQILEIMQAKLRRGDS
ncbi:MAG: L-serine ammonia-lyase, iron-sulfur-dependent, subunit alpha [Acidobacteriota bacterium]